MELFLFMIFPKEEQKQIYRNGQLKFQYLARFQLLFLLVVFPSHTLLLETKLILLRKKEQVEAVAILLMQLVNGLRSKVCFPIGDELSLSESFPSNGGLIMAAKEARYDKEALNKFFRMLIRRRYFSDELPSPSSAWSLPPAPSQRVDHGKSDEDQFYKRTSLKGGDLYKYNTLPPHNLLEPAGLYPQQPPDRYNYGIPRFSLSSVEENGNGRSKLMDINV